MRSIFLIIISAFSILSVQSQDQTLLGNLVLMDDLFGEIRIESDGNIAYEETDNLGFQRFLLMPLSSQIFADSIIFDSIPNVYLVDILFNDFYRAHDSSNAKKRVKYELTSDNLIHDVYYFPVSLKTNDVQFHDVYTLNYYGSKQKIRFFTIESVLLVKPINKTNPNKK